MKSSWQIWPRHWWKLFPSTRRKRHAFVQCQYWLDNDYQAPGVQNNCWSKSVFTPDLEELIEHTTIPQMMFYGMCGVQFPRLAFEFAESTVKHLLNKAKNMAGLDLLKAFMKQLGWPEIQDSQGQKLCDFRHIQKDKRGIQDFGITDI